MTLLGLDIGTSGCKGIALSIDGQIVHGARAAYAVEHPRTGWCELNPAAVQAAVVSVISELASALGSRGMQTRAICFSVSGDEAVPVDRAGKPLYACIMSSDARGSNLLSSVTSRISRARLEALSGLPLAPNFPLLRYLWFRSERPDIIRDMSSFFCWGELAATWLGAEPVIDLSNAGRTLMLDTSAGVWSGEVLDAFDIPREILPALAPSGTPIGTVSRDFCHQTGVTPGTVVVTGGFDQAMAALGSGISKPGQAVLSLGTWEVLTVLLPKQPHPNELQQYGISVGNHVLTNQQYAMATNPNGGVASWIGSLNDATGSVRSVPELLKEVDDGPSQLTVVPDLFGTYTPWMTQNSSAIIAGIRPTTKVGDFLKGFLESVAFDHRESILRLEAAGVTVGEVRVTGGGSQSRRLMQVKADALGRPITPVKEAEAGCIAAAVLAGEAVGAFGSAVEVIASIAVVREPLFPREDLSNEYTEAFNRYKRLRVSFQSDN